jgi:foldase protein PrsA
MTIASQQMQQPLPLKVDWRGKWQAVRSRLASRRALVICAGLLVAAVGGVIAFYLSGSPKAPDLQNDVVARVNGQAITEADVRRLLGDPAMRQQLEQELARRSSVADSAKSGESPAVTGNAPTAATDRELERLVVGRLIMHRLLLQEAARRNLTVTDKELEVAQAAVQKRFKDAEAYATWRKSVGLDDRALAEAVRAEILAGRAQAALLKDVRPSEAQIQAYYESHKAEMKTTEVVRLQVMAVPDKAVAERLVASLNKGSDFGRLAARERDKGVRSIESEKSGGVGTDRLPKEVRAAVSTLKVGQTHAPIKDGDEYLVVRLAERQPGRAKSLDEARPEIEQALLRTTQRRHLAQWLTEQRRTGKIEILQPQLKDN